VGAVPRETGAPAGATSENLFCPRVPVFSKQRGVSADTPRESQTRRRGSPGDLVTAHHEGERERGSTQPVGLRVCGPEVPAQSGRYRYGRTITRAPPGIGP